MSDGAIFGIIAGAIVAICIQVSIAMAFQRIAEEKGYHGKNYLWWCILTGLIGYLLVIALPDRGSHTQKVIIENLPDGLSAKKPVTDDLPDL